MRDLDVRKALREDLKHVFGGDPATLILEELDLCQGSNRIDLAVINGSLNGYEIKSDRDTLERLPVQQEIYNQIFDTVTLVTGHRHTQHALRAVPVWWGIIEAMGTRRGVDLVPLRPPMRNFGVDPGVLVQLLWRGEMLDLLGALTAGERFDREPRRILWERLVSAASADVLRDSVRRCLKARGDWRAAQPPRSGDGLSRPSARSSHYHSLPFSSSCSL